MTRFILFGTALIAGVLVIVYFGQGHANVRDPGLTFGPETEFPPVEVDEEPEPVAQLKDLPKPAAFDGKRAMDYLKAVCAIGPRMSATDGMKKQQELLRKHFEKLQIPVKMQAFEARQLSLTRGVDMANMIVSFAPERTRRAIICTHYDTRPIADQEPDPGNWRDPFVSANDGGSGVALMMELAHHLKDLKLEVGVDLVFFDGEEYVWRPRGDIYFFGSSHFAQTWAKTRKPDYLGAVLLDMIAGKDVRIPQEVNSRRRAPALTREIFDLARSLECPILVRENGDEVQDDHLELQKVGIQAIDLIDFRYPHWHRLTDTPENCSPEGMVQVAKVLSVWLQRLK